jgi:uncharacterized membrane protein
MRKPGVTERLRENFGGWRRFDLGFRVRKKVSVYSSHPNTQFVSIPVLIQFFLGFFISSK